MSIVDRINNQAMEIGANAKTGLQNILLGICKVFSGFVLGLTLSLIGQEVLKYGPLLFWFVIVASISIFLKLSKNWGGVSLLIFDLLCILAGLLIRMYVIVAPG